MVPLPPLREGDNIETHTPADVMVPPTATRRHPLRCIHGLHDILRNSGHKRPPSTGKNT